MRHLTIPKNSQPVLLSSFLKKEFPKGYVTKLWRKDGVRVNNIRGKPEMVLRPGDQLTFYVPFEPNAKSSQSLSSFQPDILHEDENIIVLNKKAGMAVHEGKTISHRQSLLGRLVDYYKARNIVPWLVHRLDRDTSGCLLIVKREELVPQFEKLFEAGQVEKEYLTLVVGKLDEKKGKITLPLPGRDGTLVSAITTYEVKKHYADVDLSLVAVQIKTGRMHQIRLHFAALNHPIVLDDEHGDFSLNKEFRKIYRLKRQFLHAHTLSFTWRKQRYVFAAPLPDDLQKVLDRLDE